MIGHTRGQCSESMNELKECSFARNAGFRGYSRFNLGMILWNPIFMMSFRLSMIKEGTGLLMLVMETCNQINIGRITFLMIIQLMDIM